MEERAIPEPNSGCLLWLLNTRGGYGRFWWKGSLRSAHRMAYEATQGPIPEGLEACHKCDVRSCIEPSHLFAGTRQDNMNDMVRKGRGVAWRGEENGNRKLTADQVARIIADPRSQTAIAADYGIIQAHVSRIKRGVSWASLGDA